MQFLITVNDPENGLGAGTERSLTEQVSNMVGVWGRIPGINANLEIHEEDVYGDESPKCDICGKADGPGEPDWNGETGNHLSCEENHVFTHGKWYPLPLTAEAAAEINEAIAREAKASIMRGLDRAEAELRAARERRLLDC